jgi:hypothetical protein
VDPDEDYSGHRPTEESWRQNAWYKLNVAAAIGLGAYFVGWRDAFYPWLSRQDLIFTAALVGLVGAVPLIGWLFRNHHPVVAVWAILATVLVALAAGRASGDAQVHRYYNCWTLSEREDDGTSVQMVACAPGSEPKQGSYYSQWTESGESRFCDLVDSSLTPEEDPDAPLAAAAEDANVTIWQCEQSNI